MEQMRGDLRPILHSSYFFKYGLGRLQGKDLLSVRAVCTATRDAVSLLAADGWGYAASSASASSDKSTRFMLYLLASPETSGSFRELLRMPLTGLDGDAEPVDLSTQTLRRSEQRFSAWKLWQQVSESSTAPLVPVNTVMDAMKGKLWLPEQQQHAAWQALIGRDYRTDFTTFLKWFHLTHAAMRDAHMRVPSHVVSALPFSNVEVTARQEADNCFEDFLNNRPKGPVGQGWGVRICRMVKELRSVLQLRPADNLVGFLHDDVYMARAMCYAASRESAYARKTYYSMLKALMVPDHKVKVHDWTFPMANIQTYMQQAVDALQTPESRRLTEMEEQVPHGCLLLYTTMLQHLLMENVKAPLSNNVDPNDSVEDQLSAKQRAYDDFMTMLVASFGTFAPHRGAALTFVLNDRSAPNWIDTFTGEALITEDKVTGSSDRTAFNLKQIDVLWSAMIAREEFMPLRKRGEEGPYQYLFATIDGNHDMMSGDLWSAYRTRHIACLDLNIQRRSFMTAASFLPAECIQGVVSYLHTSVNKVIKNYNRYDAELDAYLANVVERLYVLFGDRIPPAPIEFARAVLVHIVGSLE